MAPKKTTALSACPTPLFSGLQHRSCGILLHPTSLPSTIGIGNLGQGARVWIDALAAANMRYWQMCPIGPTGYGDSPYQCFSALAGNPFLLDLQALVDRGLLQPADIAPLAALPRDRVDYGGVYQKFWPILQQAYQNYQQAAQPRLDYGDFATFCQQPLGQQLLPYAYFCALKQAHQGKPWWQWPSRLRTFSSARQAPEFQRLTQQTNAYLFYQFLFFAQWREVRGYAHDRGVEIFGDVPIFVAPDSADIWTHPTLFQLDDQGLPAVVAGVPPDYFSKTGQLWGNPLYDWPAHQADNYTWWMQRLAATFELFDVVRLDHFRGFEAYWAVPAKAKTAERGQWLPGPGLDFFRTLKQHFPQAKIIAEDLGVITPKVRELLAATGFPRMAILQFAFGSDPKNPFLPHNLHPNQVVYPGSHDNDTTQGWYQQAPESEKDFFRRYCRVSGEDCAWDLIRTAYFSTANTAIIALQDILNLGSAARMNFPSRPQGNWQWRCTAAHLEQLSRYNTLQALAELAWLTGREAQAPRPG